MVSIIVAFPKPEDGRSIKNILMRNGYQVAAVCTTGAQVLTQADYLNGGIVVCGYRLADMVYTELHEDLPRHFEMLLLASGARWADGQQAGIICILMPLKVHELLSTVEMMAENMAHRRRQRRQKPQVRSAADQAVIDQAKAILMERNNMLESEAHRYIQKCSMDSGNNMAETAHMIISIENQE